jgi:hypothetical protein
LRQGWATCRGGQIDAAAASVAKAQKMADLLAGPLIYVHQLAALRAEIAFAVGQVRTALSMAKEAVELAQEVDGIEGEGLARRVWGQALAQLMPGGRSAPSAYKEEAQAQLAASLRLFGSGQLRLEAARTHLAWGIVCRDWGDPDAARAHWERAAAQWVQSDLPWERSRVQALIASLAPGRSHGSR